MARQEAKAKRDRKVRQIIGDIHLVQWRKADLGKVFSFSGHNFSPVKNGDVNYYFRVVRAKLNYIKYTCHTVGI